MTKPLPSENLVLYVDDRAWSPKHLLCRLMPLFSLPLATLQNNFLLWSNCFRWNQSPGLVILDINLPRLNGKEHLKTIQSQDAFSDVPFVLFSTSTLPDNGKFASQHNAGFVTKPLPARLVKEVVDQ